MALVANKLPVDTLVVGQRVVYFDPTFDVAGMKFGHITAVTRGTSGTQAPISLTVKPEGTGADVTGAAEFFRVVDAMPYLNV